MNRYLVQYSDNGWVPFVIKSCTMYEALEWVHANIQKTGVCITNLDQ